MGFTLGCEVPGFVARFNKFQSNFAYHNMRWGFSIGAYDPFGTSNDTSGTVESSWIVDNTSYNNAQANTGEGELMIDYATESAIVGNIFYCNSSNRLMISNFPDLVNRVWLDWNMWWTPGGANNAIFRVNGWPGPDYTTWSQYRNASYEDPNSLFGYPRFVSTSYPTPNLHLLSNSPAIGAGRPDYQPIPTDYDIDMQARIMGGRIDIGADEYLAAAKPASGEHRTSAPVAFALYQNYPNPFNPSTKITLDLPLTSYAILAVYDVLGRKVASLVDGLTEAGSYQISFDASRLPSGNYYYRLQAGNYIQTKQMMVLK